MTNKRQKCGEVASSTGKRCKNNALPGYEHCYAHMTEDELAHYSRRRGVAQKGLTGVAGSRSGKRSVPWDQDVEILARLPTVATMLLQGAKLWQVADTMGYSPETARADRERVREMWRREAAGDLTTLRDQSVAQMREVQLRAWEVYRRERIEQHKLAALREVRETEKQIIALQGTLAPAKREIKIDQDTRPLKHLSDEELAAMLTEADDGSDPEPDSAAG